MQTALAVVAQCETELLQLDDFEDIITHLKVSRFAILDNENRDQTSQAVTTWLSWKATCPQVCHRQTG